jgi:SAM-dependent methyltransferase
MHHPPPAQPRPATDQPDWKRFVELTRDNPPWPLLTRAADLLPQKGRALDLGAGGGRDTRYLLAQGFQVTAVDASPHSVAALSSVQAANLRVVQVAFEDFAFETYDLINAQYTLPFVVPRRFRRLFARLKGALNPGGVFAGQFFGTRDQWNTPGRRMTFLTREQAEAQLRDLELIEFSEEELDGHVADGSPKHWHTFNIIARRKLG